jgi:hypothetical protein
MWRVLGAIIFVAQCIIINSVCVGLCAVRLQCYTFPPLLYGNGGGSRGEYAHWSRKRDKHTYILCPYYHIGRYYKIKNKKINYK